MGDVRLDQKADNGGGLAEAYQKREEEQQRRIEQQRLVDTYVSICDSIIICLSTRIASWLIVASPDTTCNAD